MRKLMLAVAALIGLTGAANANLTSAEQSVLGAHFNKCMPDTTAPDGVPALTVRVTADQSGVARKVTVDSSVDVKEVENPAFRAYSEKIIRGILDQQCAKVPLPASVQGQVTEFKLRFNAAQVAQPQPAVAANNSQVRFITINRAMPIIIAATCGMNPREARKRFTAVWLQVREATGLSHAVFDVWINQQLAVQAYDRGMSNAACKQYIQQAENMSVAIE